MEKKKKTKKTNSVQCGHMLEGHKHGSIFFPLQILSRSFSNHYLMCGWQNFELSKNRGNRSIKSFCCDAAHKWGGGLGGGGLLTATGGPARQPFAGAF